MSSQPPISSSSFFARKVGGIPVIYLVGGFVLVLVVIAWRMKPLSGTGASDAATQPEFADDTIRTESAYPPLPLGTVTAPNPGTGVGTPDSGNSSIDTNTDWLKAGVEFLVTKNESPGAAQSALTAYLNGDDLTTDQARMRDLAIREFGLPPDPGSVGKTLPDSNGDDQPPAPSITTNAEWLRAGVAHLVSLKNGPVEAQTALSAYLDGADMTFDQSRMVSVVIAKFGLPPDPGSVGKTAPPPPRAQGPVPRAHIVKSTSEDSVGELSKIYYGVTDVPKMNLIVNANRGQAQFPVGSTVQIPALPASMTPTTHRVRTTYEDSPGELAKYYYGRTDAFAISVITKANNNRNRFNVGDLVRIPAFPKPTG